MDDPVAVRLKDIQEHPEKHHHDFTGLRNCCIINGSIHIHLMDAHPELGRNGGQKCDVTRGPCACGAWH